MQTSLTNLKEVTSKILEEMFFMYEETVPDHFDHHLVYCASVILPGTKISMITGQVIGESMAKNFLGLDDVDENDIKDVIKEMVNMIAGNYIGLYMNYYHEKIPVPLIEDAKSFDIDKIPDSVMMFYDGLPIVMQIIQGVH